MTIFLTLIIFILGLIIGSFLNCVIYRMETGGSVLKGRSFCPKCKHKLSWLDLIPVLSFLILKGRCRYCHQRISLQYPLVEIATGILFVLIFGHWSLGFDWSLVIGHWDLLALFYLLIISCFLIIIFVYDFKRYIIPDKIIYPAIVITFLYQLLEVQPPKVEIFPAVLAAGFFLAMVAVSRGRWMGMGDVKLAFFMGLFLGWPKILIALFSAFFLGAIIGIGLVVLNRKTLKSEVPFGPFLVTGTFLAMFFGEQLINWYLNFMI